MTILRKSLTPTAPDTDLINQLTEVIRQIEDAFENDTPTDELIQEHNRLAQRTDIEAIRYEKLYSSMSCKEAAVEALMPVASKVADITREELEDIAQRILELVNALETQYFLDLFELNTPSGHSDLFFWPDENWLNQLGTDTPTPCQVVEKALEANTVILL